MRNESRAGWVAEWVAECVAKCVAEYPLVELALGPKA